MVVSQIHFTTRIFRARLSILTKAANEVNAARRGVRTGPRAAGFAIR